MPPLDGDNLGVEFPKQKACVCITHIDFFLSQRNQNSKKWINRCAGWRDNTSHLCRASQTLGGGIPPHTAPTTPGSKSNKGRPLGENSANSSSAGRRARTGPAPRQPGPRSARVWRCPRPPSAPFPVPANFFHFRSRAGEANPHRFSAVRRSVHPQASKEQEVASGEFRPR